jgi:hypothetical protein
MGRKCTHLGLRSPPLWILLEPVPSPQAKPPPEGEKKKSSPRAERESAASKSRRSGSLLRILPGPGSDSAAGKGSWRLKGAARLGILPQRWWRHLQVATCSARWAPVTARAALPAPTRPPGPLVGCAPRPGGPRARPRPAPASERAIASEGPLPCSLGLYNQQAQQTRRIRPGPDTPLSSPLPHSHTQDFV